MQRNLGGDNKSLTDKQNPEYFDGQSKHYWRAFYESFFLREPVESPGNGNIESAVGTVGVYSSIKAD
ncbi:MAG TPA: hypothetical protein DCG53_10375 [Syntrophus sp. (in: bacteria)]|jgi:hypothetical protein|nr:hypothetical protein [Syntrophus sp. (in: bacteria)]